MKKIYRKQIRINNELENNLKKALQKYNNSGMPEISETELMRLGIKKFVHIILTSTKVTLIFE